MEFNCMNCGEDSERYYYDGSGGYLCETCCKEMEEDNCPLQPTLERRIDARAIFNEIFGGGK